jgi:hypothetical protein
MYRYMQALYEYFVKTAFLKNVKEQFNEGTICKNSGLYSIPKEYIEIIGYDVL